MATEQHVSGRVSGIQNRTEVHGGAGNNSTSSVNVLVFRLTPEDGTPAMHVEMRGSRINGSVVEGEIVDAYGSVRRNGVFRAKRIVSRDTGLVVDTKLPAYMKVIGVVVALFILGVFAFIAIQFFSASDGITDRIEQRQQQPQPTRTRPSMVRPPFPSTSPFDGPSEFRERNKQECLADPNFTAEQCEFLYG